jgi:hypothetical protein
LFVIIAQVTEISARSFEIVSASDAETPDALRGPPLKKTKKRKKKKKLKEWEWKKSIVWR